MLTALRVLNLVVWTVLLFYMLPSSRHAVFGKDMRRGDPMRLSVAAVCVVMILGNLRWLMAPGSQTLLAGITALSLAVGCFKIALARAYGRGPRI